MYFVDLGFEAMDDFLPVEAIGENRYFMLPTANIVKVKSTGAVG